MGSARRITGAARGAPVDFFDIKGVVEQLAVMASVTVTFTPVEGLPRRGRAANVDQRPGDRRLSASSAPAIAEARDLPPRTRCTSPRSISTR